MNLQAQPDCEIQTKPFKQGEDLTYVLSYNWFVIFTDVGYASLKVNSDTLYGHPYFHLEGRGWSSESWDKFFRVRDKYESWVHPGTLLPVYFRRDVHEDTYKLDITYNFYRQSNFARSYRKVRDKTPEHDTLDISNCTFDVVSALYYSRTVDYTNMEVGDTVSIDLLLDTEHIPFYYRYLGTETIKTKELGKVECIKFVVMVVEGSVFDEGGEQLYVWVTKDKNKVPIYAESPIVVGKVKMRLIDYENLKYPGTLQ
ncbi:MAG: DUF3108 domain-containing protein [Bacteroidetes bacterium]|jgi:hypothetical protein|nr:DUF3108 domain-containing protein [Bacteroidota bacterium]